MLSCRAVAPRTRLSAPEPSSDRRVGRVPVWALADPLCRQSISAPCARPHRRLAVAGARSSTRGVRSHWHSGRIQAPTARVASPPCPGRDNGAISPGRRRCRGTVGTARPRLWPCGVRPMASHAAWPLPGIHGERLSDWRPGAPWHGSSGHTFHSGGAGRPGVHRAPPATRPPDRQWPGPGRRTPGVADHLGWLCPSVAPALLCLALGLDATHGRWIAAAPR